jgi:hypothetical protein
MEDATRVSPGRGRRRWAATRTGAALALALTATSTAAVATEDPVAELGRALRALGDPGVLWGRFAVEEESPAGPWTPLVGVEVTLYPATPSIVAELEKVRQSARASAAQYESAVARVQAALKEHQARIDAQSAGTPLARGPARAHTTAPGSPAGTPGPGGRGPTTPPDPGSVLSPRRPMDAGTPVAGSATGGDGLPLRQATDRQGLFVFDPVPSGDWLIVAIRVAPYGSEKLRATPKPRSPSRGQHFLPRARSGEVKEAELWVQRVRVLAAERVGLSLTDRAHWLVGPVR